MELKENAQQRRWKDGGLFAEWKLFLEDVDGLFINIKSYISAKCQSKNSFCIRWIWDSRFKSHQKVKIIKNLLFHSSNSLQEKKIQNCNVIFSVVF